MTVKRARAVEVFCSYDPEDEFLSRDLEKHMRFLERRDLISAWHQRTIQAGQEWQHEIDKHLHTAHVILLLISPAFMASDQCYNIEMREAMRRHEAGEARVIPIILRPVVWEDEPFSKLQVLPAGGKPVKSWPDSDEAFLDIARSIGQIIKGLLIEQLLTEAEQLFKNMQHEQALVACEQAIYLVSNSASAYWRKGDVLLSCQKYEEALAAYQEAIHLNPNIADTYFYQNKGYALRNLKRYGEALVAFDQAIHLGMPDPDPRLYYDKGDILQRLAKEAYAIGEQLSQGGTHGTIPN